LEAVVLVVQSQRGSGARARPLRFGQKVFQATGLQPRIVVQEEEELAARGFRARLLPSQ